MKVEVHMECPRSDTTSSREMHLAIAFSVNLMTSHRVALDEATQFESLKYAAAEAIVRKEPVSRCTIERYLKDERSVYATDGGV